MVENAEAMFTHPGAVSLVFNSTPKGMCILVSVLQFYKCCVCCFPGQTCVTRSDGILSDPEASEWLWAPLQFVVNHGHQVPCRRFPRCVAERSHTAQLGLDSVQLSWWVTENIGEKENSANPLQQLGNKLPIPLVSFLCQKNSQCIHCMIFKDAEHSCCLLFPIENRAISLLIDWLLARNYKREKWNGTMTFTDWHDAGTS